MSFLISDTATSPGGEAPGGQYSLMIMLVIFGLIFYFMILRPQQKRAKDHKKLMDSIDKGDEIMTSCGLIGRVSKVGDTGIITIALNDTTEVMIKRDFVAAILPRGTIKAL